MISKKTPNPIDLEAFKSITPTGAIQRLIEGNKRFVAQVNDSNIPPTDRNLGDFVRVTSSGQFPFAVVLSCVDSRMPTELLFDQSIGDIFNARIAGNFVNEDILGSMEFASTRIYKDEKGNRIPVPVKLILVLGHTSCGAIEGAADFVYPGCTSECGNEKLEYEEESGSKVRNLVQMLDRITPAVKSTPFNLKTSKQYKEEGWQSDFIKRVTKKNVELTIDNIMIQSEDIRNLSNSGDLLIVGAMYDISTGEVDFFYDPVRVQ